MSLLSILLSRRQTIKEGVDYLEQEILSALLALLTRVTDPAEITRAHIGIEVVIKVIRASNNPRTAQRALLVAGELARLVPEGVLHNVMPIFTFMGTSELQRDDAYSFGVVEKVSPSSNSYMITLMGRLLKGLFLS
jgi:U3 small nucleolar RNA-associated protein 10